MDQLGINLSLRWCTGSFLFLQNPNLRARLRIKLLFLSGQTAWKEQ